MQEQTNKKRKGQTDGGGVGALTCSGRVVLVESPEDGADHERGGARGALLARDVGLLREARGHVVDDGHDDADGLLRHRQPLGQLELRGRRWGGRG